MTQSAPVVTREARCEYIPVTIGVCSRHFQAPLIYLFWIPSFISRCHGRSLCFAQYCLAPGHTRSDIAPPLPVTAEHKACPSVRTGPHGYARKQTRTHFRVPPLPFPCRHIHSHSQVSTPSDLPPPFSRIHNQLGSKSISHISCFSFWYSNRLVHRVSTKQKEQSGWVQSSYKQLSLNAHPFISNAWYEGKSLCCVMGFLFMYNSIMFPWEGGGGLERRRGKRVMGRGWQEVVFLVKLICTPRWGGEEGEVQMEKKV